MEDPNDEDNQTLADNFLSGDVSLSEIDVDDTIIDNDDPIFGAKGDSDDEDDDDNEIDPDDEDESDEDSEEDEENEDAEDKKDKGAIGDAPEDNEFYLRAKYWQETNVLDATLDISKDIDAVALENLYRDQIKENALNQIRTEVKDAIKARGINPDEIFGSESADEYYQREYARLSTITYDELVEKNDDVSATLSALGTEYWTSKSDEKLDEEAIAVLVATDLKTDEETLLAKYTAYFGKEAKRLEGKVRVEKQNRVAAEATKAATDAAYIKKVLSTGELGGKKYSPEIIKKVQDALFVKNQHYVAPNGDRKTVTLFDKRRYEEANSIQAQLEGALALILGEKPADIKEKHQRVGAVNTMTQLAKLTGGKPKNVSSSKKNNKTTTKVREFEEMLLDD